MSLAAYLYAFAFHLCTQSDVCTWHVLRDADRMVDEIADVPGMTPERGLQMVEIAWMESGFDPKAIGKAGEKGRWQVMPPASSFGAKEASHRLDVQGLQGFCGCPKPCPNIMKHRSERSRAWFRSHPFQDKVNLKEAWIS
jgi:hypothetical protein